jgi:hypothetical protein
MVWVVNLGCVILGLGVRFKTGLLGFGLWSFNIGKWPLVYIEFGLPFLGVQILRLRLGLGFNY